MVMRLIFKFDWDSTPRGGGTPSFARNAETKRSYIWHHFQAISVMPMEDRLSNQKTAWIMPRNFPAVSMYRNVKDVLAPDAAIVSQRSINFSFIRNIANATGDKTWRHEHLLSVNCVSDFVHIVYMYYTINYCWTFRFCWNIPKIRPRSELSYPTACTGPW